MTALVKSLCDHMMLRSVTSANSFALLPLSYRATCSRVVSSPLDDICIDILKDEPRRQRDSNVDNDDDITMTTITMALDYNGNDCGDIGYVNIDH